MRTGPSFPVGFLPLPKSPKRAPSPLRPREDRRALSVNWAVGSQQTESASASIWAPSVGRVRNHFLLFVCYSACGIL